MTAQSPQLTNGRGGPRGSRPNDRIPARISDVTTIVGDTGDIRPGTPCPACGFDAVQALDLRLAACTDAWKAGWRVGRESVRDVEITSFMAGWTAGHDAGVTEGRCTA